MLLCFSVWASDMSMMNMTHETTRHSVKIDPTMVQDIGIQTAVASMGPVVRRVRTVGEITPDESLVFDITTKFSGWLEKLYVSTTGAFVALNQPLFSVYSPEVFSAAKELSIAFQDTSPLLRMSAVQKLKNFGFDSAQIEEMRKEGPKKDVDFRAFRQGVVLEKKLVEGQMVQPGMSIYRIADLSRVWVLAAVYEQDVPFIKRDQIVTIDGPFGLPRKGTVDFIYPTVDPITRTVMVRIILQNADCVLKPEMYVTVEFHAQEAEKALLIPANAVIRSGEESRVFVALGNGYFEPRVVDLGVRTETNMYQILSGLKEGEEVVTSAQFLLDSESLLQEEVQKMGATLHQH